jgi:hypothetical protein
MPRPSSAWPDRLRPWVTSRRPYDRLSLLSIGADDLWCDCLPLPAKVSSLLPHRCTAGELQVTTYQVVVPPAAQVHYSAGAAPPRATHGSPLEPVRRARVAACVLLTSRVSALQWQHATLGWPTWDSFSNNFPARVQLVLLTGTPKTGRKLFCVHSSRLECSIWTLCVV